MVFKVTKDPQEEGFKDFKVFKAALVLKVSLDLDQTVCKVHRVYKVPLVKTH